MELVLARNDPYVKISSCHRGLTPIPVITTPEFHNLMQFHRIRIGAVAAEHTPVFLC
jgi:hypothetical protein